MTHTHLIFTGFTVEQKSSGSTVFLVIASIVVLLCCGLIAALAIGGYVIYSVVQEEYMDTPPTPQMVDVTPFNEQFAVPTITPHERAPVPPNADLLTRLSLTHIPEADPRELAERLKGIANIPLTYPSGPFAQGDSKKFWVLNVDSYESAQINATLQYVREHVYFWVQDGVNFNRTDMERLVDAFNDSIYPTNVKFFGSEWSPGVDEDPRIYILYARGLGISVAGYYASVDQVHPLAYEYSNGHEIFMFNADNTSLASRSTYGVLAHEHQHMIHWYRDANETTWLNEGFSEFASFINGYGGSFERYYTNNTDLQLNTWPNLGNSLPHYGASFLYVTYFYDRFGASLTQQLAAHPENGLESVDIVLQANGVRDPISGAPITADDFFIDWALTNYLHSAAIGDGRYQYSTYRDAPKASFTESSLDCKKDVSFNVRQYGVDYIPLNCVGEYTLTFTGSQTINLLPAQASPYSGQFAFWSNASDTSNMRLTRAFDLRAVNAPIEMTYHIWYDIEEHYDYLYLVASTDNGATWTILNPPRCTTENPVNSAYGCGYSGTSNGWVQERVDLSQFAGQNVLLRFEYVTDAAVHGEGWLLDDVSLPAINYFSDFESDEGGWNAEGFVRIENQLPQTFRLALITTRNSETSIEHITLDAAQRAEISIRLRSGENAVLVVSGTTRFTRQPAEYSLSFR
jgi:immune inhibitor A